MPDGPADSSGQSGAEGATDGPAGAGTPGSGMPDVGGEAGSGGSLEDIFGKSLGDFDGEIGREREAMAKSGEGTAGAAGRREAGDARAVKSGPRGTLPGGGAVDLPGSGSMGEAGSSGEPPAAGMPGSSGGPDAGAGQTEVESGAEGKQEPGEGGAAPDIPDDIPADGSAEDQVARQIREAAMAETDPKIREALWDEYRRHMGIKKK